jgi:hypothetical protein
MKKFKLSSMRSMSYVEDAGIKKYVRLGHHRFSLSPFSPSPFALVLDAILLFDDAIPTRFLTSHNPAQVKRNVFGVIHGCAVVAG